MDELYAVGMKLATNMGGIYLGDTEPVQLEMLRMTVDESHIVYGRNYPHSPGRFVISKKKHFEGNRDYDAIREKIYMENAYELLNKGGRKE